MSQILTGFVLGSFINLVKQGNESSYASSRPRSAGGVVSFSVLKWHEEPSDTNPHT